MSDLLLGNGKRAKEVCQRPTDNSTPCLPLSRRTDCHTSYTTILTLAHVFGHRPCDGRHDRGTQLGWRRGCWCRLPFTPAVACFTPRIIFVPSVGWRIPAAAQQLVQNLPSPSIPCTLSLAPRIRVHLRHTLFIFSTKKTLCGSTRFAIRIFLLSTSLVFSTNTTSFLARATLRQFSSDFELLPISTSWWPIVCGLQPTPSKFLPLLYGLLLQNQ